MALSIYAPATIANLTVGFDSLGLAVSPISGQLLGDVVTIDNFDANVRCKGMHVDTKLQFSYQAQGENAKLLPATLEQNLVYKAYMLFRQALEAQQPPVAIKPVALTLTKHMPIGSGLGSSSCSSVATLVALNQFHGNPLDQSTMLQLMGELEGAVSGSVHYDNVAPAYLGGLQLMSQATLHHPPCVSLPMFTDWYFVIAYPGTVVKTEDARNILPASYDRATVISQVRSMANFVHALYADNRTLAATSLVDLLAEPYRKSLLPNMPAVATHLAQSAALAHGISGSGPTYYAIAPSLAIAQELQAFFQTHYLQNDQGFVAICQVDTQGARAVATL